MAYKVNGTTVVDNSRNVTACCVTSCCITASSRMDIPSGNTASRPGSPATGSLYFDTDDGSLIVYNGSEWAAAASGGGGVAKFTAGFDGNTYCNESFYTKAQNCGNYCACSNGYCQYSVFRVPGSMFKPASHLACANFGPFVLGGDGSFSRTSHVMRIHAMRFASSGYCTNTCMHGRQHVFFAKNGCIIEFEDSLTTNFVQKKQNTNCHCPQFWTGGTFCCQDDVMSCCYDGFYNLTVSSGLAPNGGYVTFGKCPAGCVKAVVPFDSMLNGLCQAYCILNSCVGVNSPNVQNHWAVAPWYSLNSNYESPAQNNCWFGKCGGTPAHIGGARISYSPSVVEYQYAPYTCACCLIHRTQYNQDCNPYQAMLPLGDLTDPGFYGATEGDCINTKSCGPSGCFRFLIGVGCRWNYTCSCFRTPQFHAVVNSDHTKAVIVLSSKEQTDTFCYSTGQSAQIDQCMPRVALFCIPTACFKTWYPQGCGRGGGSEANQIDCSLCHAGWGPNLHGSMSNYGAGTFYNWIGSTDCVRIIRSHDVFANGGPHCCLYAAFSIWNTTNFSLVCSYQMCGIFCDQTAMENRPKRLRLVHFDESTCRGLWHNSYGCMAVNCCWANRGFGMMVTKFDFSNRRMCLLNAVKFCYNNSQALDYGYWGRGAMCQNVNCQCCAYKCTGFGLHVNQRGDFMIVKGGASDSGCDKCNISKVAAESWTTSAYDSGTTSWKLCCMFGGQDLNTSVTNSIQLCTSSNGCKCTNVACKHPTYCCQCCSTFTGNFSYPGSNATCIRVFPESGCNEGFCLYKTGITSDHAFCWLDRKKLFNCNFGNISGLSCTGAVHQMGGE